MHRHAAVRAHIAWDGQITSGTTPPLSGSPLWDGATGTRRAADVCTAHVLHHSKRGVARGPSAG